MGYAIKREASKLADQILSEHEFNPTKAVPVRQLAGDMGISIHEKNLLKDVRGNSNVEEGEPEIILEESLSNYQARFTIAHEIGHLLVDDSVAEKYRTIDVSASSEREMEEFCHKFAARLLVPRQSIVDLSDWSNITIQNVGARGAELEVSLECIMRRVLEIAPGDGGFLLFDRMQGVNVERPFKLSRGIFPSSGIRSAKDSQLIIPYDSDHFADLVEAYDSGDEYLITDVSLNLSPFYRKDPIKTTVLARRYRGDLLLVVTPPEVSSDEIAKNRSGDIQLPQHTHMDSFG